MTDRTQALEDALAECTKERDDAMALFRAADKAHSIAAAALAASQPAPDCHQPDLVTAQPAQPITVQDAARVLLDAMRDGHDPFDASDPAIEALAVKHAGNMGDGVIQLEIAEEFFTGALRGIAEGRA